MDIYISHGIQKVAPEERLALYTSVGSWKELRNSTFRKIASITIEEFFRQSRYRDLSNVIQLQKISRRKWKDSKIHLERLRVDIKKKRNWQEWKLNDTDINKKFRKRLVPDRVRDIDWFDRLLGTNICEGYDKCLTEVPVEFKVVRTEWTRAEWNNQKSDTDRIWDYNKVLSNLNTSKIMMMSFRELEFMKLNPVSPCTIQKINFYDTYTIVENTDTTTIFIRNDLERKQLNHKERSVRKKTKINQTLFR